MSCEVTRRELLTADHPNRPPVALRPHLSECAACRAWLRHLVTIESRISQLPIPSSVGAKANLLHQLRELPGAGSSVRVVVPELPFIPPKERGLRKAAFAVALAAAVVVLAIGLSLWPRHAPVAEPAVAARTSAETAAWLNSLRDARLAQAQSPRQRVELLAEFADSLLREARQTDTLPGADRLELLAKVYLDTIQDKLLTQAREYARLASAEERQALLPRLAGELARTESEFERLAADAPDSSATSLRLIAAAARDGDKKLRELVRDAST
jgi:hypothetical protein